jgi:hypothetical protein
MIHNSIEVQDQIGKSKINSAFFNTECTDAIKLSTRAV